VVVHYWAELVIRKLWRIPIKGTMVRFIIINKYTAVISTEYKEVNPRTLPCYCNSKSSQSGRVQPEPPKKG
jgi:hypothetical protein